MCSDLELRFRKIMGSNLDRHPLMTSSDIYKLLFQAAMGNSHAFIDIESARSMLEKELMNPGSGPVEPLKDVISPCGRITRVNLRPYAGEKLDSEVLLSAFIRTGREFRGSEDTLELYCSWFIHMKDKDLLAVKFRNIDTFFKDMMSSGFPAVHHSAIYRNAYSPAYRVVALEYLDDPIITPAEE
ncbi:MAG: hypothetical protein KAW14_06130 [Candidatus Aegiribacteria sp.]|nr:hypothetical protein [Candidatus Aegiribacteria sp.]